MKNLSIFLCALLWFTALSAQNHPANGISYQAMLSQSEKITYGTKLQNIPVANKDIKARFELSQSGAIVFTDEHLLTTDVNGIFSCIIGTGNTTPFGALLTDINWGLDSVTVRVFIDAGEGENLFSEQKLWSTAYAMYAPTAGRALNDKDTSATNELQYLNLVGDSVKLTSVSGGISLKPWTDGIAKNALDIATEKTRAEAAELALQNQIGGINITLANKTNELNAAKDTLTKFRNELNILSSGVTQNKTDIATNKTDISDNASAISKNSSDIATNKTDIGQNTANIKDLSDSISVHRSELNKNRGDINKNASDIANNKTDIATNESDIAQNKTDIGTNATDIGKNKTDIGQNTADIKDHSDSISVHRSELNKNRGDINKNTAAIAQNKTDLSQHISNDKDTDNTNELSDLSYNSSTSELSLSNPSTSGNKVDLSSLKDNLGNHTAQDTLDLNGNVLTDNTGDTLLIAIKGNDRDIAIESEDEVFIRTINNPNNATNGDIQLESSDEIILDAQSDINLISGDDITIKANGDDITLESSDDIKIFSGDELTIASGNKDNINIDSDNDIELITTDGDFVEIWKKNSSGTPEFMYTLPNDRGSVGQFLQRSNDGSLEYFSDWSTYKLPTSDGSNGQTLVTDGSGNVSWGTSGDNLGNHKATQNIELNGKYLSNDGGNEGVFVDSDGDVAVGTNSIDASASLQINSTTKGLLTPRMTTSQRDAISNAATGLVIYNTNVSRFQYKTPNINMTQDSFIGGSNAYKSPGWPLDLVNLGTDSTYAITFAVPYSGTLTRFNPFFRVQGSTGVPPSLTVNAILKIYDSPSKTKTLYTSGTLTLKYSGQQTITLGSGFMVEAGKIYYAEIKQIGSTVLLDPFYTKSNYRTGENIYINGVAKSYSPGFTYRMNIDGKWLTLSTDGDQATFSEVDGSTTNELQDLSYNPTTKKLTLSTPKTSGNEVDLSGLGGASKLDDLSDVKGPQTNFNKSLLIGNTTTGTLNNASGNVGMGHLVLRKLSSGRNNTVIGAESGMDIDASFNNTLIGYQAGHKVSTKSYNTAIGATALFRNSAGQQNVAVGQGAGSALLGSFTTSIGTGAASGNSKVTTNSGDNNTYIGYGAQPTSSTAANEIVLGNSSVQELYTAADMNAPAFTTTSDRRLKKNIQPLESALDKVIRLNPVVYDKKRHMTSDVYEIHEIGFIAQELQQEFPEVVSQQPDENHTLGVNYQALIPVLTKATQEQQIIIEKQQQTIQKQNETIEALIRRIEALEAK